MLHYVAFLILNPLVCAASLLLCSTSRHLCTGISPPWQRGEDTSRLCKRGDILHEKTPFKDSGEAESRGRCSRGCTEKETRCTKVGACTELGTSRIASSSCQCARRPSWLSPRTSWASSRRAPSPPAQHVPSRVQHSSLCSSCQCKAVPSVKQIQASWGTSPSRSMHGEGDVLWQRGQDASQLCEGGDMLHERTPCTDFGKLSLGACAYRKRDKGYRGGDVLLHRGGGVLRLLFSTSPLLRNTSHPLRLCRNSSLPYTASPPFVQHPLLLCSNTSTLPLAPLLCSKPSPFCSSMSPHLCSTLQFIPSSA